MKRIITIATLAAVLVSIVVAQAPPMPKPQPEHQKLQYFAGDWKSEGEMKPGPFGPGGKFTTTDHNQMVGDFFLVMHSEGTGPMGAVKEVAVMGYDPQAKQYTYDAYNSMGEHSTASGTLSGQTWTWMSPEQDMGGKKVKGRFVLTEVSPTSYTFTFDSSVDGGPWSRIMDGKATKVK